MNNLIEPLNEDELDLLDTFLLHRVDDDAETEEAIGDTNSLIA